MKTFRIEGAGFEGRVLGVWRGDERGSPYEAAAAAARHATGFALALQRLNADPNLSELGRIEPARVHATERLAQLSKLRTEVDAQRAGVSARQAAALNVAKADPSDAITDAAIATWLRGMDDRDRFKEITGAKLGTGDPRIAEAIVRLPAALAGLTTDQRSAILAASVQRADPEGAQALTDEADALDDAAAVLSSCTEFVSFGAPAKRGGRPTIAIDTGPQPLKSLEGFAEAERNAA